MTASQNEQLEAAAKLQYDSYKAIPVADRTNFHQVFIENYEATHGITEEVQLPVTDVQADDDSTESEATAFDPELVKTNPDLMELHTEKLEVQKTQGITFKDPKYANFFSLWTTASAVSKQAPSKVSLEIATENEPDDDGVLQNNFGSYLAAMLGLHCFSHIKSRAVLNKAVKEQQIEKPYATVCAMHLETSRNTAVKGDDKIKEGNILVVHADAPKYEHNDKQHIARFKDILESETVPTEKDPLTEQSHEVFGLRYQMTKWHSTNKDKIGELIKQLATKRPESIEEETFKAWSGVLAVALMTSQELYKEMWQLMIAQSATHNIPKKVKLAAALKLVLPTYIKFLDDAGVPKEKHLVNSGLLRQLLTTTNYAIAEMSEALGELELSMKENKAGLPLDKLQATYANLPTDDDNLNAYIKTLKE
ncbi:hypothetical protein [Acinetobacter pittii]|uniref:hypothetical protein n=1 Tax=Acinetobacter pittii TaxID=48296 RepID=UPI00030E7513|nr:hypothetical protein [Acinetobacter pittii]MCM5533142.1 hypothetical protein [Acinetobacter pittii]MCQ9383097.1 hypothetical protein [Acinetobacter pittii]MCR3926037.1 hypothetical protein [Acinetobacter pittii]RZH25136.1 hypothetical protein EXD96_18900 [Acinetobacter pittii]